MALKRRTGLKFSSAEGKVDSSGASSTQASENTSSSNAEVDNAQSSPSAHPANSLESIADAIRSEMARENVNDDTGDASSSVVEESSDNEVENLVNQAVGANSIKSKEEAEQDFSPSLDDPEEPQEPEYNIVSDEGKSQEEESFQGYEPSDSEHRSGLDDFLAEAEAEKKQILNSGDEEKEPEVEEEHTIRKVRDSSHRVKQALSSLDAEEKEATPVGIGAVEEIKPASSTGDDDDDDLPPPPWEVATQSFGSTLPPSVQSLMDDDKDEPVVESITGGATISPPPSAVPTSMQEPEAAPTPHPRTPPAPVEDAAPVEPIESSSALSEPEPEAAKPADPTDDWDIADLIDFKPKTTEEAAPSAPAAPVENTTPSAPIMSEPVSRPASAPVDAQPPIASSPSAPPKSNRSMPPWASQTSYDPPPELPGDDLSTNSATKKAAMQVKGDGNLMRNIMLLGLFGLIIFGTYIMFFKHGDRTSERLARITGTLNDVSQDIPPEQEVDGVKPDEVVDMAEVRPVENVDSNTQIEFLEPPAKEDVAAEESAQSESGSLFSNLQKAIIDARAEKRKTDSANLRVETEEIDPTKLSREQRVARDARIRRELEEELAAYRKALTSIPNPALRPDPDEYFSQSGDYSDQLDSPLPRRPSDATVGEEQVDATLAPNPQNLPIIAPPEMPQTDADTGVRTMRNFDVTMFEPPRARVRMPENIKPLVQPTSFPKLLVLSMIPNRGIIAQTADKEGVLLIGETIQGWELVAVYERYAEFQAGRRKHVLTLEGNI